MGRKNNTTCRVCGKGLYRRPSNMKKWVPLCWDCRWGRSSAGGKTAGATKYLEFIERWKLGLETGLRGRSGAISRHLRKFLFLKYDSKCSVCGWGEANPFTGVVPLEAHHLDGNYANNVEENLCLLCPNCHSLTGTYRGSNRGNGRPR